jgi:hypothetical protein
MMKTHGTEQNMKNMGDCKTYGCIFSNMEWRSVIVFRPGTSQYEKTGIFEKDVIKWTNTYQVADFYKTLLDLKIFQSCFKRR